MHHHLQYNVSSGSPPHDTVYLRLSEPRYKAGNLLCFSFSTAAVKNRCFVMDRSSLKILEFVIFGHGLSCQSRAQQNKLLETPKARCTPYDITADLGVPGIFVHIVWEGQHVTTQPPDAVWDIRIIFQHVRNCCRWCCSVTGYNKTICHTGLLDCRPVWHVINLFTAKPSDKQTNIVGIIVPCIMGNYLTSSSLT